MPRWSDRGHRRRLAGLALPLALSACVPSGHLAREQASTPSFDPISFFAGRTEGNGSLAVVLRHRRSLLVEGQGVVSPDGTTIALDQDVRHGHDAPTHRTWQLHRVAPGRYAGTLSDAIGPVTGDTEGNRLHLAFAMKGGLHAQQWLYLQPGSQVVRNRMVVTKFGIPVASLDETITRIAPVMP